jgi:hypothetical protein
MSEKNIGLRTIEKLAKALKMSSGDLLNEAESSVADSIKRR